MRPRCAALLGSLLLAVGCADGARAPNVVLIVVDTLRADAVGAYGNAEVDTPHVDRLASEGVLFERAYAAAPWTRASLAALLSGIDPDALGVEERDRIFPTEVTLLAEHFRAAGYQTAGFVANPNVGSFYGFARGFETYAELYRRRRRGVVSSHELVATASELSDRATEWLAIAREPFFLLVFAIDPHGPYRPPKAFAGYRGRSGLGPELERLHGSYLGEVSFTDHEIGRVLAKLDDRGLRERTLVAFTSDHGEEFEEHGMRGHGHSLYDEELRVPLVLRLPGVIEPGTRVATPVQGVDLAPTVLALAGLPVPGDLDGRVLAGSERSEPGAVYASLELGGRSGKALVDHPWKLVVGARTGGAALFHLENDPSESTDRAAEQPAERARLAAALAARSDRNARRADQLGPAGSLPPEQLPADAREALEALGYLEPTPETDPGDGP